MSLVRVCSYGRGGGRVIPPCTEIQKGRVKGNEYFKCKRRECCKKLCFYNGTFFEKSNLGLKSVFCFFCLSSYWAKHWRLTYEEVAVEVGRRRPFSVLHGKICIENSIWKQRFVPSLVPNSGAPFTPLWRCVTMRTFHRLLIGQQPIVQFLKSPSFEGRLLSCISSACLPSGCCKKSKPFIVSHC